MAKQNIEKSIDKKIKSIEKQISDLQVKLDEWTKISNDYQINKTTIESILSLHSAPAIDGSDDETPLANAKPPVRRKSK